MYLVEELRVREALCDLLLVADEAEPPVEEDEAVDAECSLPSLVTDFDDREAVFVVIFNLTKNLISFQFSQNLLLNLLKIFLIC